MIATSSRRATPLLAVVLGGLGLIASLANVDYVVMPALFLGAALVSLRIYRRHVALNCSPNGPGDGGQNARPQNL